jgi:hypothetical protein
MFVKKSSVTIKSILRTSAGTSDTTIFPTGLSVLRDEESGRLLTIPVEVITRVTQMETKILSPNPTLSSGASSPWLGHVRPTPTPLVPMFIGQITPSIFQEVIRRTPNHKAAGPDGVQSLVLKHMPPAFHEALQLHFQAPDITGTTTSSWLQSHTILPYKKGDPTRLDNYRPITFANALYKLRTTCVVTLATDYLESRKI